MLAHMWPICGATCCPEPCHFRDMQPLSLATFVGPFPAVLLLWLLGLAWGRRVLLRLGFRCSFISTASHRAEGKRCCLPCSRSFVPPNATMPPNHFAWQITLLGPSSLDLLTRWVLRCCRCRAAGGWRGARCAAVPFVAWISGCLMACATDDTQVSCTWCCSLALFQPRHCRPSSAIAAF
jgi:hypothetical protein